MDDKVSDRGDVATHKRHGRQYTAAAPSSQVGSATATSSSASTAPVISSSLTTMMRRYAPSILNAAAPGKKTKAGGASAVGSTALPAAPDHIELYTMRDKTDATAKRAFRVQIPVRLMYTISAVFLIIPIMIFGWKETHLRPSQQKQSIATTRIRRSDEQARQDSNWMEEHLLTTPIATEAEVAGAESVSANVTILNENGEADAVGAEASQSKPVDLQENSAEGATAENVTISDPSLTSQQQNTTASEINLNAAALPADTDQADAPNAIVNAADSVEEVVADNVQDMLPAATEDTGVAG